MDTELRHAAEVLLRHGEYDETPDSVEWLRADAEAVAKALATEGTAESVLGALADTGWWGFNDTGGGWWGQRPEARAVASDLGAIA